MLGLSLLLICNFAKAFSKFTSSPGKKEIMDTYLNAVIHGKIAGLENAIDDEVTFDIKRGVYVNTLSKNQLLKSLKSLENIEQDCQYTKTVLQDDDEKSILKVDMKYNDFTRTDVITAQHTGNEWKITKVETSFK